MFLSVIELCISEQKQGVEKGVYRIIMMSPETLFHGKWRQTFLEPLYRQRVRVLTVDEAHCVVEWYGNALFCYN